MARLTINGTVREVDAEPDTPLLWVIREQLGLTGTKYGCGIAQCGACTVHIDGVADALLRHAGQRRQPSSRRSSPSKACRRTARIRCRRPGSQLDVPQCGYCQSGMIMAAAALLKAKPEADRRRHRRGDHQHLPLRHLQPRPRGDQARRLDTKRAAERRQDMSIATRRLTPSASSSAAPPPPAAWRSASTSRSATSRRAGRTRRPGDQRLGGGQAGRHRRHPHRPLRDGPGHADRPRPARRRRARLRLGQGHDRIPDARPEPRAQPRLGQFLDRRQPRHPRLARLCAQGRRRRARDAGPGRRRRMEGAGRRVHASPTA